MKELKELVNELKEVEYDLEALHSVLQAVEENAEANLDEVTKLNVHAIKMMLENIQNGVDEKMNKICNCIEENQ